MVLISLFWTLNLMILAQINLKFKDDVFFEDPRGRLLITHGEIQGSPLILAVINASQNDDSSSSN